MSQRTARHVAWLTAALLIAVRPAQGQSIFDSGLRGGPQYVTYQLADPTNLKISELAVPLFVTVPVNSQLTFDVGTAYASAHVQRTDSTGATSSISGLTDTQVRANYTLGTDFLVLTAGMSLPTGRATATTPEILAAGLIGSEFLSFPIGSMGTGLGGTGGLAIAVPMGGWNVGLGLSGRRSARYQPFEATGGEVPVRFVPGNEYRARIGLDHPVGTGSIAFGFTYSKAGNDSVTSGSASFNTGDRMITQLSFANTLGFGDLVLSAWNLFRKAGTLADGTISGHENLLNGQISYGFDALGGRLEPNVEARDWTQELLPSSVMATFGLRYSARLAAALVSGSGGYALGKIAAATASGANTTASLSGLRLALALRFGP